MDVGAGPSTVHPSRMASPTALERWHRDARRSIFARRVSSFALTAGWAADLPSSKAGRMRMDEAGKADRGGT